MSNDDNKTQLIKLLLAEWQLTTYASKLQDREVFFVCGEECQRLTSDDGVSVQVSPERDLFSSQEEADTRIILHCLHMGKSYPPSTFIVVRSPDTEVFVLLLKYVQGIDQVVLFDTGTGNKRRLLNIRDVVAAKGSELCSALPGLHSFSGCDTTSAFVRRGKVGPLKTLEKHPEFLVTFSSLGQCLDVSADTMEALERFVCCMYGKGAYSDLNGLRYDLFAQKYRTKSGHVLTDYDGTDLSILPPCRASLQMHICRANYQAFIWQHADQGYVDFASPVGHGWSKDDSGNLSYTWTQGPIMPQELIDIVCDEDDKTDDEDDSDTVMNDVDINNMGDELFDDDDDDDEEDDDQDVSLGPPPPYSPPPPDFQAPPQGFQAPPPGFQVPPPGFQPPHPGLQQPSGPIVACECCGFGISTADLAANARLIQCTVCRQHTAVGPPPPGKKYVRCTCKKLLHCNLNTARVKCPGCKTLLTVGSVGTAPSVITTTTTLALGSCRIICAHCNQVMLFRPSGIARCPHCRSASSVGPEAGRTRAIIYFILAFVFLGGGIGVTVGTYASAVAHGGYYFVWTGAYISGLIWLLLGIRYAVIRTSYPESQPPA